MTKRRAFLTHLVMSALLVGTVCALVFFSWYPFPYFAAKGAWNILAVLVGVDLVVGPLLTLYLYRPNKPGLMIDMTFIVVVQLAALIYGTTVIYTERPYFAVFAVDRFEVIARHEVDLTQVATPELLDKPLSGPILVVALLPDTTEGMQRLLDETVFEGKPDIERRPEFWRPYAEQVGRVIARLKALDALAARDASRTDRLLEHLDRPADELGYVPLIGKDRDFAFVIDKQTGAPIDLLDIDPWPQAPQSGS